MFIEQNLWDIIDYLKTGVAPDTLDENLSIVAASEKAKSKSYFENVLDQACFATDDYKRLRSFIIDWYSAHKSLTTVQKQVSDVFALPVDHLNALMTSYGYNIALDKISHDSKIEFFLELVNLYKIKGTPTSIIKALSFYEMRYVELVEYSLERDTDGQIIFRGHTVQESSSTNSLHLPYTKVIFDEVANVDPHWMLTRDQIEYLVSSNAIALPSKTPYFGLRPVTSTKLFNVVDSILSWQADNEFRDWSTLGVSPIVSITVPDLPNNVSFLSCYLSVLYLLNIYYIGINRVGNVDPTQRYECYNGTATTIKDIVDDEGVVIQNGILTEYSNIIKRPITRRQKIDWFNKFTQDFSKPVDTKFLSSVWDPGNILSQLDPDTKAYMDELIRINKTEKLIGDFLKGLTTWISVNISALLPDLVSFVMGITSLGYIYDVVNFWKPYRSRILNVEHAYIFGDPLRDSVVLSDWPPESKDPNNPDSDVINMGDITETIVDFDTADMSPNVHVGVLDFFITSTPPVNEYIVTDIFGNPFDQDTTTYHQIFSPESILVSSTPDVGEHRITNMYLADGSANTKKLVIEWDPNEEVLRESNQLIGVDVPGTSNTLVGNCLIACKFTAFEHGLMSEFRINMHADSNVKFAIYSDFNNDLGSRLWTNNKGVACISGWNQIQVLPAIELISGVNYWLAIITEENFCAHYLSGVGTQRVVAYDYEMGCPEVATMGVLTSNTLSIQGWYSFYGTLSTPIKSAPAGGCYRILDIYRDSDLNCVLSYDESALPVYAGEQGKYYARERFDNDNTYFDAGASVDFHRDIPNNFYMDLTTEETDTVRLNTHRAHDESKYTHFSYQMTGPDVTSATVETGFCNFDEGGIFDSVHANEICQITVQNI